MRSLLFLPLLVLYAVPLKSQAYKLLVKPVSFTLIPSMDISSNGDWLAVCRGGSSVDLWNIREGEKISTWSVHPTLQIGVIAFSPDATRLAALTGYRSRLKDSLFIWDLSAKTPSLRLPADSLNMVPRSLTFSADGNFLIGCTMGMRNVTVWNLQTRERYPLPIDRFGLNDCRCALSDNGTLRVADQHRAYDFHYQTGELIGDYPNINLPMIGTTNSVSLSENGKFHASSQTSNGKDGGDKTTWITITEVASGKIIKKISSNSGEHPALAFSPDGTLIAIGDEKGKISAWNITDDQLLYTAQTPDSSGIWCLKFSPAQNLLISLGSNLAINIWKPEQVAPALSMCTDGKGFAAVSANGHYHANAAGLAFIGRKSGSVYLPLKEFDAQDSKNLLDLSGSETTFSDLNKHPDAPRVSWIAPPEGKTSLPVLPLKIQVISGLPIKEIRVFHNHQWLTVVPQLTDNVLAFSLPLREKQNEIFAEISNQYGTSKTKVLSIEYTPDRNVHFYAVLFAVEDYKEGKLQNSLSSADSLRDILDKRYGFQTEMVKNPSASEMMTVLTRYRKKIYGPNDHLLVYFSGHGYLSQPDSVGYILLKNTEVPAEEEDASQISHSVLGEELLGSNCNHVLLILDACYSSYFGDAMLKTKPEGIINQLNKADYIASLLSRTPGFFYLSAGASVVSTGTSTERVSPFTKSIIDNLKRKDFQTEEVVLFEEIRTGILKSRINPTPRGGYFGKKHNLDANFIFLVKK